MSSVGVLTTSPCAAAAGGDVTSVRLAVPRDARFTSTLRSVKLAFHDDDTDFLAVCDVSSFLTAYQHIIGYSVP